MSLCIEGQQAQKNKLADILVLESCYKSFHSQLHKPIKEVCNLLTVVIKSQVEMGSHIMLHSKYKIKTYIFVSSCALLFILGHVLDFAFLFLYGCTFILVCGLRHCITLLFIDGGTLLFLD